MKKHEIIASFFIPVLEISGIIGIFFIAYSLRQITDGIPFIQLPIPYISPEQFLPFILSGAFLWWLLFMYEGLYRYESDVPLMDVIRRTIQSGILWFILYIGFVYLSLGFIFSKEIPRLIIVYVWILSTLSAILIRVCIHVTLIFLHKHKFLKKTKILIVGDRTKSPYTLEENIALEYSYTQRDDGELEGKIRSRMIDMILVLDNLEKGELERIVKLCSIYGVRYSYPKIPNTLSHISHRDRLLSGIPVIESSALAMSIWDRIMKRTVDIILSLGGILLFSPLFLIIALAIKGEDPNGPVIYKNRRIGAGGREFFLYKFRYMYWKYSVKDAYGMKTTEDSALQYEENLKKSHDTRNGPLYKIANDPRKTRVGSFIEKLSLDELPQLWNVLRGEMSLVGPRPHQPREVELYDEHHFQLLTVKPGITGMAQTRGREKNSFEEEASYDIYYIEHYSLLLDILIIVKTFFVVIHRAFR